MFGEGDLDLTDELSVTAGLRYSNDRKAIEILQSHLPKHKVIGVDCTELIWGLGAIHCLTQQQPKW